MVTRARTPVWAFKRASINRLAYRRSSIDCRNAAACGFWFNSKPLRSSLANGGKAHVLALWCLAGHDGWQLEVLFLRKGHVLTF